MERPNPIVDSKGELRLEQVLQKLQVSDIQLLRREGQLLHRKRHRLHRKRVWR